MADPTLLIVYYSRTGHVRRMAEAIAKGAIKEGADVLIKTPRDCTRRDLLAADGIAFGSPSYYSTIAWPLKRFIDEETHPLHNGFQLRGKLGFAFCSAEWWPDVHRCLVALLWVIQNHEMTITNTIGFADDSPAEVVTEDCIAFGRKAASAIRSKCVDADCQAGCPSDSAQCPD
jgi:multimeric flavodoxin WrbA